LGVAIALFPVWLRSGSHHSGWLSWRIRALYP